MVQGIFFGAGFVQLSEWSIVMVVVLLSIIHHVVCGESECVSNAGPGPLPAHYSLAVRRVCACVWVGCVFRPYWLFLRRRDPHYCPHTVTSICFPPSFFSSSWHALQLAPNVPCAGPTRTKEGGEDCKTKTEKTSGMRERAQIWEQRRWEHTGVSKLLALVGSLRENRSVIRLRVCCLWTEIGLWPCFDPCPAGPSPRAPLPKREATFTVMYCTAQCAASGERGRSGFKTRESLCEGRGEGDRARERRHNECVKISLAHPEKNSSICY